LNTIITEPYIQELIKATAIEQSRRNYSLSRKELENDIISVLFIAILNEFKLDKNISRIVDFICSRIRWRTKDYVKNQSELVYLSPSQRKTEGENGYFRIVKISIEKIDKMEESKKEKILPTNYLKGKLKTSTNKKLDDMILDSNLSAKDKALLVFVYVLGYSFSEVARIYSVSNVTIWNHHKLALVKLKKYVKSLTEEERFDIASTLNAKSESFTKDDFWSNMEAEGEN
jgi:predicted DNA-binding protein YlxM (UPF0122 family)